jgi:GMP synthase (glutamine-hydrolysing)
MITDDLPWSVKTEKWIPSLIENGIPFFGICYGHQLLARAGGGSAGFHPHGREIGTVKIQILPEGKDDVLFGALPRFIPAHAVHAQTVLRLPPGAVRLALNSHESNHAFRLGDCAWGVQFHPEYNVDIMRSYIEEQKDELESAGFDVSELINGVVQTSDAAGILENFVRFVEARK